MQVAPRKSLLVPTAEHDRVLYLRLFREFFRLPAAIVFNTPGGEGPHRARHRQRGPARRGGGHRHRPAGGGAGGRGGPAARPPRRLRRLRGADRAREGLRGHDRPLPALAAGDARHHDPRPLRPLHHDLLRERPRAAHGRRAGRREAGRDRALPRPRHALPPREPVDGRARGVDDGPARARERRLRGAARPGAAGERRALLPPLRGVRGGHGPARVGAGPRRPPRPPGPRLLRGELRLGPDPGEVRAAARRGRAAAR